MDWAMIGVGVGVLLFWWVFTHNFRISDMVEKKGLGHRFDDFKWSVFLSHGGGFQLMLFVLSIYYRVIYGKFHWSELIYATIFILGWPIWEVLVHKYQMHTWKFDPLYEIHQVHHDSPYDSKFALVPVRQIMYLFGVQILLFGFGLRRIMTIYSAVMMMLVFYEFVHYSIHTNRKPKTAYGRWVQKNHRQHHFLSEDTHMGLLFPIKWTTWKPTR